MNRFPLQGVAKKLAFVFVAIATAGVAVTGCSAPQEKAASTTPSNYDEYNALYADWRTKYIECARRYGADAKISADGEGIDKPYAKGRPLSEEGLDADCIKEVGKEPPLPPADESYFHGLYALLQESATCLRSKGFRVSEAPSEDVWVETYSGTSWYPWLEIMNTGGDADAALRACPQPKPMDIERKGKEWAATKG
ncbi:hypothetical protein HD598_000271 [Neomicrococcus aestuarii]|uniref:Uncharacterized protein n=1 Tax=Neomicrococcus aestuarii TaxID=556325 RepID=A0A7W8TRJ1_9MICC|nr:hypothetical protein [Neomicrococcus aestuarii]MBB5511584.1 hypothetical protein [Neomicrococcus aestuarii]